MTPHSAPCCTSACGLGLPIRPFGHMYPLATCLACLPVSKSSLLPTRNFLSMAVSLYCSELSTLLSQDPPCLPSPISPATVFPTLSHLIIRAREEDCLSQSGRVLQLQALPPQRLLLLLVAYHCQFSFQLSFIFCLSQSTAKVQHGLILGTTLQVISYTPISGDIISFSLKATSDFHYQPFRLVAPCLFLAKIAGIGKHMCTLVCWFLAPWVIILRWGWRSSPEVEGREQ